MSEPPRSVGRMVVGGVFIGAACLALFLVPSAWLVHRGHARWLALAVGLAAFPIAPFLWHLLAERRRKRGEVKSSLTPRDRFLMRLVAVALVAIAPLLVFSRGSTWTALKQQWSWPLHWGGGDSGDAPGWEIAAGAPITGDARLINYLPDDAEAVIWLRATKEFLVAMSKQFPDATTQETDPDAPQEVMMALRKEGFLAIIRSRLGLEVITQEDRDKLEGELAKNLFGGKRIPLLIYTAQPDLHVVVTENWDPAVRARAAGTRPAPTELLALLDGAPKDAPLVAAAHNASVAGVLVDRGTGYMRVADKGLRIETNMQLASATAAGLLRSAISGAMSDAKKNLPDRCKEPVDKLNRGIEVGGEGTAVVLSAKLGFEELMAAMFCQLGSDDD